MVALGKGLPVEEKVALASTVACPGVRGLEVSRTACVSALPAGVEARPASVASEARDVTEAEADVLVLGAPAVGLRVVASAVTAPDPALVTPGPEEGAEDASAVDGGDVVAKPASVVPLVLLGCGLGVAAEEAAGDEEEEERLVASQLGPRDGEAAMPLAVTALAAVAADLIVRKEGLVASLPSDAPSELPSGVGVVGAVSVLPSPPDILVVEGVASDRAERAEGFLALGSAVVLLPWFGVGLSPSAGGVVARLAAEAMAALGKGLPVEEKVALASTVACPGVRGLEVSRAACVSALPAGVEARPASVASEDTGYDRGRSRWPEEGAEDASAVDGGDVVAKPASVVPLVLLGCGVGVAAEEAAGDEEEEERLVASQLGPRDGEAALPLAVTALAAVAADLIVRKEGLVASLPPDAPSELPSGVGVVGAVSVLPSPPTILVVEGVASDRAERAEGVLVLGSAVVLLPWFGVGLSPSAGGVVARLAAEAMAALGKGLPVEEKVALASTVACPGVRGLEVSRTACVSALPAGVEARLASVASEARDVTEAEADVLVLGAPAVGLRVVASAVTAPDPALVTPGPEEGAEDASAVDGGDVVAKPASVVPLVLLGCGLGVAAEEAAGDEEEEERLVASQLGPRDGEAAMPLAVTALAAVAADLIVRKEGLVASLPPDAPSELPSGVGVVGAVSVLPSPPDILVVEGVASDRAERAEGVLVLGSAVVLLPWFGVGLSPSAGGVVARLAAEAMAALGKGLPVEEKVALASTVACPGVRGLERPTQQLVTPGPEEGAEDASAVDGGDVAAKPASVVPLVLLGCGLGVAAEEAAGDEEEEERLVASQLGPRDGEAALPLDVTALAAVVADLIVRKEGLVASLPPDAPSELPSGVGVVGAVSVLPSPPAILVVEGVASDRAERAEGVLVLGSAVVLLPWFGVGLSPSAGGVVARLPAEAMAALGKGLPVEEKVALASTVACPGVRGLEAHRQLGCAFVASAVTAPDPALITPGPEEGAEDASAVDGGDVVAKSASVVPLVLLGCGLGVAAEEAAGDEEEEERLVASQLGPRDGEAALPVAVTALAAVAADLIVRKEGLVASLPPDAPSELPSGVGVVGAVSVLPSPPTILVVEGVASDRAERAEGVLVLGSAVVLLPWFGVGLSPSAGGVVARLAAEAMAALGKGLPMEEKVALASTVACPGVRGLEVSRAACVSALPAGVEARPASVASEARDVTEAEADVLGLGAPAVGLRVLASAVTAPDPTLITPGPEEGAEDASAVDGGDVVAKPASMVPLVLLGCGLGVAAEEAAGDEEEEERLVASQLGPRDGEAALPLAVTALAADLIVRKEGLVASLPPDAPSELPSGVGIVGAVSVLPSPPTILVVKGVASDRAERAEGVLVLGSAVVLLPWFGVGLSPSAGGVVARLAAEAMAALGKGLPVEEKVALASTVACPGVRGLEVSRAACVSALPAGVEARPASVASEARDVTEAEADVLGLGAPAAGLRVVASAVTAPDPALVTPGPEEGAEDASAVDGGDVAAKSASVVPLVLLGCGLGVAAEEAAGDEEEEERLVASQLGPRDGEAALPVAVTALAAVAADLIVRKEGLVASLPPDAPSELPSGVGVVGAVSVLPSPPAILVVKGVASDRVERAEGFLALGSAVVLLPWFGVGLSPSAGGVVARLAAEAMAALGKGLPVEEKVALASTVACPGVRGLEVSRAACIFALPAGVEARPASVASEDRDMTEAEADVLGLGAPAAGLRVVASAVTAPDPALVTPGPEEGAEDASAVDGGDVVAKPASVVPLVLLGCGLGVAAEEAAGDEEEEERLVASQLGPRDGEAALPLDVTALAAVVADLIVRKEGLVASLPPDAPSELPSGVGVVGAVSVLPSPPAILVVKGVASDRAERAEGVLVLGSAVVLLPWFGVGLSPSAGGVVARLAAEAMAALGKGLPVEEKVALASTVACPGVRGLEVSRAACVSALPAGVEARPASVAFEARDVTEAEADVLVLGAPAVGLRVVASAVTAPDPALVTPGPEEGAEDASAVDGGDVVAKPASVVPLVLLGCGLGVAAEEAAGDEEEEERLVASQLGPRDGEAAMPLAVTALAAVAADLIVRKEGLVASLPPDAPSELPSGVGVVGAVSVLLSPPDILVVEGVASDRAERAEGFLALGSAVVLLPWFGVGLSPSAGGVVARLAAEAMAALGKGLPVEEKVALASTVACPGVRGLEVIRAACISALPAVVEARPALVASEDRDMTEAEADVLGLGAPAAGLRVVASAVTAPDPALVTPGPEEGAEDASAVDGGDVAAKSASVVPLVLLGCGLGVAAEEAAGDEEEEERLVASQLGPRDGEAALPVAVTALAAVAADLIVRKEGLVASLPPDAPSELPSGVGVVGAVSVLPSPPTILVVEGVASDRAERAEGVLVLGSAVVLLPWFGVGLSPSAGGVVARLAAEAMAALGKGLPVEEKVALASTVACPGVRGLEVSRTACVSALPAGVEARLASVASEARDVTEAEADVLVLGAPAVGLRVVASAVTAPDPALVTPGPEEGAEDASAVDGGDVVAKPASVVPLVLLGCGLGVAAEEAAGDEEEEERLVASQLGPRDGEAAMPLAVTALAAVAADLIVRKEGLVASLPPDAPSELPSGVGVVGAVSVLLSPPDILVVEGVASDRAERAEGVLVLGSAVVLLPWFGVGLSPSAGGVVARLAAEAMAALGKGLPVEEKVALASTVACPGVRGLEVSRAACISALPAVVEARPASVASEDRDMTEAEADVLGLGAPAAGLRVVASAVTAPDPALVTPGPEEGAEDASAVDGGDVAAKPASVVPLVLLGCGLGVAAEEAAGDEEEEERLVASQLGPRDGEAALPLDVTALAAVVADLIVRKEGLVASLPPDAPSELPSGVGVVGAVSVLPSPPAILVVEGVASDRAERAEGVLVLGSAVVLLPWFGVGLSPSAGGVVARLPAEAMAALGKGLPVEEKVALASTVACPGVRGLEVSRAACVSALPAGVEARPASVASEARDVTEAEADVLGLGAPAVGLRVLASAVTAPDPTLITPGPEEGAEDASAVDGGDVVAKPASMVPLVLLGCGLGVAAEEAAGDEEEEERLVASQLGPRDGEAALPLAVTALAADLIVRKEGLVASLPPDAPSELPSGVGIVGAVSVLPSPPTILVVKGVASDRAERAEGVLVLGSAVVLLPWFGVGLSPSAGGVVARLAAEAMAALGKGLPVEEKVALASTVACPGVRGLEVSRAACVSALPAGVEARPASVASEARDVTEAEADVLGLGAPAAGLRVVASAVTAPDPALVTPGPEEGAEDASAVDGGDVAAKSASVVPLVLLGCGLGVAAEEAAGDEEEEERLVASQLGPRDGEAALPVAVTALAAVAADLIVRKEGLVASLPPDAPSELPSGVGVVGAVSVLPSPPAILVVKGVASDRVERAEGFLALGSAVVLLPWFGVGLSPSAGGVVARLAAEAMAALGKGLPVEEKVALASTVACPGVRGLEVSRAACIFALPAGVEARPASVASEDRDMTEAEADVLGLGAPAAGLRVVASAVTAPDPALVTPGPEEGAEDASAVDGGDVVAKPASVVPLVLLGCGLGVAAEEAAGDEEEEERLVASQLGPRDGEAALPLDVTALAAVVADLIVRKEGLVASLPPDAPSELPSGVGVVGAVSVLPSPPAILVVKGVASDRAERAEGVLVLGSAVVLLPWFGVGLSPSAGGVVARLAAEAMAALGKGLPVEEKVALASTVACPGVRGLEVSRAACVSALPAGVEARPASVAFEARDVTEAEADVLVLGAPAVGLRVVASAVTAPDPALVTPGPEEGAEDASAVDGGDVVAKPASVVPLVLLGCGLGVAAEEAAGDEEEEERLVASQLGPRDGEAAMPLAVTALAAVAADLIVRKEGLVASLPPDAPSELPSGVGVVGAVSVLLSPPDILVVEGVASDRAERAEGFLALGSAVVLLPWFGVGLSPSAGGVVARLAAEAMAALGKGLPVEEKVALASTVACPGVRGLEVIRAACISALPAVVEARPALVASEDRDMTEAEADVLGLGAPAAGLRVVASAVTAPDPALVTPGPEEGAEDASAVDGGDVAAKSASVVPLVLLGCGLGVAAEEAAGDEEEEERLVASQLGPRDGEAALPVAVTALAAVAADLIVRKEGLVASLPPDAPSELPSGVGVVGAVSVLPSPPTILVVEGVASDRAERAEGVLVLGSAVVLLPWFGVGLSPSAGGVVARLAAEAMAALGKGLPVEEKVALASTVACPGVRGLEVSRAACIFALPAGVEARPASVASEDRDMTEAEADVLGLGAPAAGLRVVASAVTAPDPALVTPGPEEGAEDASAVDGGDVVAKPASVVPLVLLGCGLGVAAEEAAGDEEEEERLVASQLGPRDGEAALPLDVTALAAVVADLIVRKEGLVASLPPDAPSELPSGVGVVGAVSVLPSPPAILVVKGVASDRAERAEGVLVLGSAVVLLPWFGVGLSPSAGGVVARLAAEAMAALGKGLPVEEKVALASTVACPGVRGLEVSRAACVSALPAGVEARPASVAFEARDVTEAEADVLVLGAPAVGLRVVASAVTAPDPALVTPGPEEGAEDASAVDGGDVVAKPASVVPLVLLGCGLGVAAEEAAGDEEEEERLVASQLGPRDGEAAMPLAVTALAAVAADLIVRKEGLVASLPPDAPSELPSGVGVVGAVSVLLSPPDILVVEGVASDRAERAEGFLALGSAVVLLPWFGVGLSPSAGGVVARLAAEAMAALGKGLPVEEKVALASTVACPGVRGLEVIRAACISALPAVVEARPALVASEDRDMTEAEADVLGLGAPAAGLRVVASAVTAPDPALVTPGPEEGAEDASAVDGGDVAAKSASVVPLVLLGCGLGVAAEEAAGDEEEEERLVASQLGPRDGEAALPVAVTALAAVAADLIVRKEGLVASLPPDAPSELPSGVGVVGAVSVLPSPPTILVVEGVASDRAERAEGVLVLGSAVVLLPWFGVGLSPSAGGVVARLAAEAMAALGKGLPVEEKVALASTVACPGVRGLEVSRTACVSALPAGVEARLASVASEARDVTEAEADVLVLGAPAVGLRVVASAVTAPDPALVTPGPEEGAEDASAVDGGDVVAKPASVVPLVLLGCGLGVAAEEAAGDEEEEERLVASQLGPRDGEAAMPLAVTALAAVAADLIVRKEGLVASLPPDAPSELPSGVGVVGAVSVLLSPPDILVVEGVASDRAERAEGVLVLGSAVVLLPWFGVGLSPSAGGVVARLAAEAMAALGKGLPVEEKVALASTVACPGVRGLEVSRAACISALPAVVEARPASVASEDRDMTEAEADVLGLGAPAAGLRVVASAVTAPDPALVTPGPEEGAEDASAVDGGDVAAKPASMVPLVLLGCGLGVAAEEAAGDEEEEERLVASQLGPRDGEAALPLDVTALAAVVADLIVRKEGLVASLPPDAPSELPSGVGVVGAVSVLPSPPAILVVEGVASDRAERAEGVLVLGSAVVLLPWFGVGLSPSAGGVVARLPAEAMAALGKGLPVEEKVALASTVACPGVRGLEVSRAACISALPAVVEARPALVAFEARDVTEAEADVLGLGAPAAGLRVLASAVTAPDPALITPGPEEGAEDASAVDGGDVVAKSASVVPLVLLGCGLGVAAEEAAGDEEEEERLVASQLGPRDGEAALPVAVTALAAVAADLIVRKEGLVASLPPDAPSELPSGVGVVGAVSVLPSPPTILVVEGVASDRAERAEGVLVLGSAVVLLPWFGVGLSPSAGGVVARLAAEAMAALGKGLPMEEKVALASTVACPGVRGLEAHRQLDCAFVASAVTAPDPTLITPGPEEGAEDASAVDGGDVVAKPASVVPLVLLGCGLGVAAEEAAGDEEEEERLVASQLGPRDGEAALPLAVTALAADLIVRKEGLVASLPPDAPSELPSGVGIVGAVSVLPSPPTILVVKGVASDRAERAEGVLVLGSAVVLLPWFGVGLSPSAGGVVARLAAEAMAALGKGLPVEEKVALASTVACPGVRGLEVSRAACVSALPAGVEARPASVASEARDVTEAEADVLGLGAPAAGLRVVASAVTAPDPALVTPGPEEGAEDASAVDGGDVAAKSASVVPLVLLGCGLGVAAEEAAGDEEEEERLVASQLGPRDGEAALPVAVTALAAVAADLIVRKEGLVASLPPDAPSELPSGVGVVGAVSVLPSPPAILVVKGVASDRAERAEGFLALGSAVVLLPWFGVGLSPSAGGVVARLAAEAMAALGKGLPVEEKVALASTVACPGVRGLEVSRAACISALPAGVEARPASVASEDRDMTEAEADVLGLGAPAAGLRVVASAVTAPDPALVTPGPEEGAEDASAVDGGDVVAKPASVVPLVLLGCGLGVAAEEAAGDEEEEERLVASQLGPRDGEAALPLAVTALAAVGRPHR
ncbi:mucin-4-like [Grus japonensis]|uniref:Mucin-4-like n=1 Tax=Grus japonensis TaxID=30415 RepID=A0ABC9VY05_GRUJA